MFICLFFSDHSFVVDVYEPSPPMPTYLVAFGVSDLSNKSDKGSVRVFTRASAIEDATLALNVAQVCAAVHFIRFFTVIIAILSI